MNHIICPLQEEMLETKVFDDLNDLDSEEYCNGGHLPPDLDPDNEPQPEPPGCMPYLLGKLRCELGDTRSIPVIIWDVDFL